MRREARGLWRGGGRPSRARLFEALLAAHGQAQRWASASRTGQAPCVPSGLGNAHAALAADLATLNGFLPVDVWAMRPATFADLVDRLGADVVTLRRLPRVNELAARLGGLGLDPLLAHARQVGAEPDALVSMFDHCWYASILDHVSFADPRVGAFDGPMHSRAAADYRAGDHAHIASTATRVQRAVAEHVVAARDAYPEESRPADPAVVRRRATHDDRAEAVLGDEPAGRVAAPTGRRAVLRRRGLRRGVPGHAGRRGAGDHAGAAGRGRR
jgi:hypothetical protein